MSHFCRTFPSKNCSRPRFRRFFLCTETKFTENKGLFKTRIRPASDPFSAHQETFSPASSSPEIPENEHPFVQKSVKTDFTTQKCDKKCDKTIFTPTPRKPRQHRHLRKIQVFRRNFCHTFGFQKCDRISGSFVTRSQPISGHCTSHKKTAKRPQRLLRTHPCGGCREHPQSTPSAHGHRGAHRRAICSP